MDLLFQSSLEHSKHSLILRLFPLTKDQVHYHIVWSDQLTGQAQEYRHNAQILYIEAGESITSVHDLDRLGRYIESRLSLSKSSYQDYYEPIEPCFQLQLIPHMMDRDLYYFYFWYDLGNTSADQTFSWDAIGYRFLIHRDILKSNLTKLRQYRRL